MKTLGRFISSPVTTTALPLIYAFGLVTAAFIEEYHGTTVAKTMIYYSPIFPLLQFLLIANFMTVITKYQLPKRRRWGLTVTRVAFIVILLGALIPHPFGEGGILHLHEGEANGRIMICILNQTLHHTLPFSVELVKLTLTRYPDSTSPSIYESELLVYVDGQTRHVRVYTNNVLDVKGYCFFQASYDPDEQETAFSVNRDIAGRNITYIDYAILMIGFILYLVGKNSRFMKLSRQLKDLRSGARKTALLVAILLSVGGLRAQNAVAPEMKETMQRYAMSPEHAAKSGTSPIQSVSGRMLLINTLSSRVLRKLHKSDQFGSLNSGQSLLSVLVMLDMWVQVPFIALSNNELANHYNFADKDCVYIEVFDNNGRYKLREKLEEACNKISAERTRFGKGLIELDEQVNILHQLVNYQMLSLFPREDDLGHEWYVLGGDLSVLFGKDSMFVTHIMGWYLLEVQKGLKNGDWEKTDEVIRVIYMYQQTKDKMADIRPEKIQVETKYNQMDVSWQCKKGYLILGGLLLVSVFVVLFEEDKWVTYTTWVLSLGILAVSAFRMYEMGMRWYTVDYTPWSNSRETVVYVVWVTALIGLLFIYKSTLTSALATLLGGIILLVLGSSWVDPQISSLVPVLKSSWLMFHVAAIVEAYGFFGISCPIGLMNLVMMSVSGEKNSVILKGRVRESSIVNKISLWIESALMTIGIFLGAVWADEPWGRYQGWDPKETWVLITMTVYAVATRLRPIPKCDNLWLFNFTSILAFCSMLMIFFDANCLLSGTYSYGQNDNVNGMSICLYLSTIPVLGAGFISYQKGTNPSNVAV